MSDLFDDIQKKSKPKRSMLDHFRKKSETQTMFNEVDVGKRDKDKDKGIIIPPINYIEDENSNA